jgi:hypothetical protein
MIGLLSDHDIEFYAGLLWSHFTVPEWQGFGVSCLATFRDLEIEIESSDREVWSYCQEHGFLLVTANRNMDESDSLEATIRELGHAAALPILTISRPKRLMNAPYREDCAYRIADIVIDLARYRARAVNSFHEITTHTDPPELLRTA